MVVVFHQDLAGESTRTSNRRVVCSPSPPSLERITAQVLLKRDMFLSVFAAPRLPKEAAA
jgi:hypothetical protein